MNKWVISIIALAAGLAAGYPTGALLMRGQRDAAEKQAADLRYELEMTRRNVADQHQADRRQAEKDAQTIADLTQQARQAAARTELLEQELQKRPVAVEQYTSQIKEWSGTGNFDTPAFDVKGPWMVQCTMTEGAADELLLIGVHRKRGATRLVDTLSLNGPGQTSTVIYDSGRYYLAITGGGSWRVQVMGRSPEPQIIQPSTIFEMSRAELCGYMVMQGFQPQTNEADTFCDEFRIDETITARLLWQKPDGKALDFITIFDKQDDYSAYPEAQARIKKAWELLQSDLVPLFEAKPFGFQRTLYKNTRYGYARETFQWSVKRIDSGN